MFISMLDYAIHILGNFGKFIPVLLNLAERHKSYGCTMKQFEIVAHTLIRTLKKSDSEWNVDVSSFMVLEAWQVVYEAMSCIMSTVLSEGSDQTSSSCSPSCNL
eukprot:Awhi_evm1s15163